MLRTFFYFLIRERNLAISNPCAKFYTLERSSRQGKAPAADVSAEELDRIFAACDEREKTIFATLLLTGMREEELCYLTWKDVELGNSENATVRVSGEGKQGFSPKGYEERIIPIPKELAELIRRLPQTSLWAFLQRSGTAKPISCAG